MSQYWHENMMTCAGARDATPPPPAPLAHRPAHPTNVMKLSSRSPLRSPSGPDTPPTPPGSTMRDLKSSSQPPAGTSHLNLEELDESLDHSARNRKASSMPAVSYSPQSNSPPVWVPRFAFLFHLCYVTWLANLQSVLGNQRKEDFGWVPY